jgi:hypothetical protein
MFPNTGELYPAKAQLTMHDQTLGTRGVPRGSSTHGHHRELGDDDDLSLPLSPRCILLVFPHVGSWCSYRKNTMAMVRIYIVQRGSSEVDNIRAEPLDQRSEDHG